MKKLIAILLAALLVFGLAACTTTPAQPTPAPATPTPAAPAETPGEPAPAEINWPANVELVVPAGPGGDSDFNARLHAAELSRYLPPNFIVSNVTGAGGVIGLRQVKDSAPDGSTAVFFHSAFVVNQVTGLADFGFEAFEFAAVAAAHPGQVLLVRADLGINTLQELFEYSQANPGELRLGVETGTISFATGVLLMQAGLDVTMGDSGPAAERIAALLGGHVDIVATAFGLAADHVANGTFVALGIDGREDLIVEGFEPILSFRSQGIDVAIPFYYFLAFPAGTDLNMIDAINEVIYRTVTTNADYQEALHTFFQTPTVYLGVDGLAIFTEVYRILSQIDFS